MPYMDRLLLALVTFGSASIALITPSWPWVSGIATALVGVVGLITTVKVERRALREEQRANEAEARARREEDRAVRAEDRAEQAERREREAHAWDRERRDDERAEAAARKSVMGWVEGKKSEYGTAPFHISVDAELDVARAAERLGWIELKELKGSEGVVAAKVWVLL